MENGRFLCEVIGGYLSSLQPSYQHGEIKTILIRENGDKCEVILSVDTEPGTYPSNPTIHQLAELAFDSRQVRINFSVLPDNFALLPHPELSSSFTKIFQELGFTVVVE